MKKYPWLSIACFLISVAMLIYVTRVHAQTAAPYSFSVSAPHTACPAAATGVSQFCFATDGEWQSLNGGAWTQLQPIAPAVTINGMTGTKFVIANTNTAPISSVTVTAQ